MPHIHDGPDTTLTPAQVRQLCREDKFHSGGTTGFAPGHAQANVLILPQLYADDFRAFCKRNPVPCPLIGETKPGDPTVPASLAKGSDIRTDCGRYCVYTNGEFVESKNDILAEWGADSVAFFIGCSYSFEEALVQKGFELRHVQEKVVLPVYKTTVQLMPAGVFSGRMVVSMRPYPLDKIAEIKEICRPYSRAHGEPVGWGAEGAARLGITDVEGQRPDWGSPVTIKEGEVPVYWACGVTPQLVVMDSKLPERVCSHSAGHMLVLDMPSDGVCD